MEKIDKIIEILQAFKEGKDIQYKHDNKWKNFYKKSTTDCLLSAIATEPYLKWRIKPDPEYRPYQNAEEFLKDSKIHGPYIRIQDSILKLPTSISDNSIIIIENQLNAKLVEYPQLRDTDIYKWQDGHICSILIEE